MPQRAGAQEVGRRGGKPGRPGGRAGAGDGAATHRLRASGRLRRGPGAALTVVRADLGAPPAGLAGLRRAGGDGRLRRRAAALARPREARHCGGGARGPPLLGGLADRRRRAIRSSATCPGHGRAFSGLATPSTCRPARCAWPAPALHPPQAFRWGRAAAGVQFHLEVAAPLAAEWAAVPGYAAALERALGPAGCAGGARRPGRRGGGAARHRPPGL